MSSHDIAGDVVAYRQRRERGMLRVTGADRVEWLNNLLTNDLKQRDGPRAYYSAWLTPQGRMITDLAVIETGIETFLDVPAPLAAGLAERLDRLIFAEDARVEDISAGRVSLWVSRHSTGDLAADPDAVAVSGDVVVTHALPRGLGGVHFYLTPADAASLAKRLEGSGAVSLDDQAAEERRVEAGVPAFLVDMGEETIPLEAGLDAAISHTKGCYVGQEIIVRIRDRGHGRVARKLVGLRFSGGVVPAVPQGVTNDGRHAGRVTSAVMSPALQSPIGLATLLREFVEPGTSVVLEDGTPAVVSSLPFVA